MANLIQPSARDSMTFGARMAYDVSGLKCLAGQIGSNSKTSFKNLDGSAYAVPNGKVFQFVGIIIDVGTAAANSGVYLGYADNDVGLNSSTAFTNGVYVGGDNSVRSVGTISTGRVTVELAPFRAAAGKYIVGGSNSGSTVLSLFIFGYEV